MSGPPRDSRVAQQFRRSSFTRAPSSGRGQGAQDRSARTNEALGHRFEGDPALQREHVSAAVEELHKGKQDQDAVAVPVSWAARAEASSKPAGGDSGQPAIPAAAGVSIPRNLSLPPEGDNCVPPLQFGSLTPGALEAAPVVVATSQPALAAAAAAATATKSADGREAPPLAGGVGRDLGSTRKIVASGPASYGKQAPIPPKSGSGPSRGGPPGKTVGPLAGPPAHPPSPASPGNRPAGMIAPPSAPSGTQFMPPQFPQNYLFPPGFVPGYTGIPGYGPGMPYAVPQANAGGYQPGAYPSPQPQSTAARQMAHTRSVGSKAIKIVDPKTGNALDLQANSSVHTATSAGKASTLAAASTKLATPAVEPATQRSCKDRVAAAGAGQLSDADNARLQANISGADIVGGQTSATTASGPELQADAASEVPQVPTATAVVGKTDADEQLEPAPVAAAYEVQDLAAVATDVPADEPDEPAVQHESTAIRAKAEDSAEAARISVATEGAAVKLASRPGWDDQTGTLVEASDEVEEVADCDGVGTAGSRVSAKARRKAALSRADVRAAEVGDKSGLLDAYVQVPPLSAPSDVPASNIVPELAQALSERGPSDVDDWEAQAEQELSREQESSSAASVQAAPSHAATVDNNRRRYTRDFLLTFESWCSALPPGAEERSEPWLRASGVTGPLGPGPSRRGTEGPGLGRQWIEGGGRSGFGERSAGGVPGSEDRWAKGRGAAAGPPPGAAGPPGIGAPPPGRIGSARAGDMDKWTQRGPPPPPSRNVSTRGGGTGDTWGHSGYVAAPALHRTGNAYKVGTAQSDDPELEASVKKLTALLNKLTPDNFERLTKQLLEVPYSRLEVLKGLIDQLFDKALSETTFTELYAELTATISPQLPEFDDPTAQPSDANAKKLTFRRLLLNKCQDEFIAGTAAMTAVSAREQSANEGTAQAPEASANGIEAEALGEAAIADKVVDRQCEAEQAQAELTARRRMLGNMQFIGQLYKKRMLTEFIMRSCIEQLLHEMNKPREEDIECLCKLMSTIGLQLESSPKSKAHVEVYLKRMRELSENSELPSRHRFMLKDVLEMRANSWKARRAMEGPKKIAEVHAEARRKQEEAAQKDALERQHGRRGSGFDRRPSSGMMPRTTPAGPRPDDRIDQPIRTMQRTPSTESLHLGPPGMLRPGGGMLRGDSALSLRPAGRGPSPLPPPSLPSHGSGEVAQQPSSGNGSVGRTTPGGNGAEPSLSTEKMDSKCRVLLEEWTSRHDRHEAETSARELLEHCNAPEMLVMGLVRAAVSVKGTEQWEALPKLLLALTEQDKGWPPVLSVASAERGVRLMLNDIDEIAMDLPRAPIYFGWLIATLVGGDVCQLQPLLQHVMDADSVEDPAPTGEETACIASGRALDVVAAALQRLASIRSPEFAAATFNASGFELVRFLPQADREDAAIASAMVDKAMHDYELSFIAPNASPANVADHVEAAVLDGEAPDELLRWLESNMPVPATVYVLREVVVGLLRGMLPHQKALGLDLEHVRTMLDAHGSGYGLLLARYVAAAPLKARTGVVYGVQQFFHEAGTPKGMMAQLCKIFHDGGMIGVDVFSEWRQEASDGGVPGKQKALFDCNAYLSELETEATVAGQEDEQ